ncbi:MAG: Asp-tRNA(Asn)/Glu-tRNA(Gln) amidotransferase subunit GatC [Candidatus Aenigmarchaeota archaeon]|nr:Asp-tRNA(Asn)/Glu-tRNA(Gln) amidotransferase subunit GatC [Candidatus Aenigmarchaeota archaeon]
MADYWNIDRELVKRVSSNARLNLSDEELESFTSQLKEVLKAFKSLDEVNTEKVKPSFHPQEISDVYREDKAEKFDWDPLANTKHKEGKNFKGPKIL